MVAGALSRRDFLRFPAFTPFPACIDSQNNHWLLAAAYDICTVRLDWKRVGPARRSVGFNRLTNHNLTNLCHSIGVCARLPHWAANGMCSSVLSARNCSKNAANGKMATASLACAKPSRKRNLLTRKSERGTRKNGAPMPPVSFPRSFVFVFRHFASFKMFGTIKATIRQPKALAWSLVFHFPVPRSALRV